MVAVGVPRHSCWATAVRPVDAPPPPSSTGGLSRSTAHASEPSALTLSPVRNAAFVGSMHGRSSANAHAAAASAVRHPDGGVHTLRSWSSRRGMNSHPHATGNDTCCQQGLVSSSTRTNWGQAGNFIRNIGARLPFPECPERLGPIDALLLEEAREHALPPWSIDRIRIVRVLAAMASAYAICSPGDAARTDKSKSSSMARSGRSGASAARPCWVARM